jgi:[ribosomal protein S5]-alanine N-acetyltransferase
MSFHPTTQRLILRPLMLSDMRACVAILDDYDVARNMAQIAHPFTETLFREALVRIDQNRCDRTGSFFAVTRAMDGALIGACAVDRTAGGAWEFGYWYGKPYWRQGYATEAARPVMRLAFEELGAERLVAHWFFDNPASGRVLEKLGFVPAGMKQRNCIARGCEVPSNRVELTKEQFARKKAA